MPESVQGPFMIIMTFNPPSNMGVSLAIPTSQMMKFQDLFGVLSTRLRVQDKLMLSAPCIETN